MSRASDDDGADGLERVDIGVAATLPAHEEPEGMPMPSRPPRGMVAEAVEPARVFAERFHQAAEPQKLGRHAVLGTLGQGGMGVVLRAYDRELDRQVALKVLHRELGEHHTTRLRREAQAMAKLSHPNVVQVYEVGELDGQTFVAMELVKGKTLREWLQQQPPPDWRACVRLFLQLGAGLAAAHERGLVHRDFKPGNAIIDDKGRARVLDFGLARQGEDDGGSDEHPLIASQRTTTAEHEPVPLDVSLTTTGAVLGTPAYMPPEQMRGQQADARSDQFSFCVSLYEAVYGQRPYEGSSMVALMVSMESRAVRPPPKRNKVPAALRRALLRGLAVDPAERWPAMEVLLERLRSLVAPRRGRWIALSVGVGLLAIGGGLGADRFAAWASRCTGARAQLDGIWDEGRKQQAQAAILGTELSYAPETWQRVQQHLDEYTDAWIAEHTEVCEATAVRGEQGEEVQALRMGCLHERRSHLRATVDVLAHADAEVVENAVRAVASLPRLSRCADVDALETEVPPPEDPAVAEQVAALDERLATAVAESLAGKYREGLARTDAVVAEAMALGYEPLLARAWLRQGQLQEQVGDYEGAVTTLRQAYDAAVARRMTKEAAKASAVLMAVSVGNLTRHEEARGWAMHADPLSRAAGSDEARAEYLHNSGMVSQAEGNLDAARDTIERARAIYETALGPDHLQVAACLGNLGVVAQTQGKLDVARDSLERARAIYETALGPDHPAVAHTFNNLGNVARAQGKLDVARSSYERALAIYETALGPDHPDVAKVLGNLGVVTEVQGKLDESRGFHERSRAIFEKTLGSDHVHVAIALHNLGIVATLQGKLDEARDFFARAVTIWERTLGPDHSDVALGLNHLGTVEQMQGKLDAAHGSYARAVAIWEKTLGPNNRDLATAFTELGTVAQAQGKLDEARGVFARALTIYEEALGPDHPDVASPLMGLGEVLLGLGKHTEGIAQLERALSIRTTHEVDPTLIAETRFVLARALWVAPATRARDRPRAHALAEQARDAWARAGSGSEAELAEVEQWLAAHRLR